MRLKNTVFFAFMALFGLFLIVPPLYAETGISLHARFYDRKVYYLEEDPIFVLLTLSNNSPSPFRFRLADERAFSVDFDVRTNSNRPVEHADILVRRRTRSQQVFSRDVTIETGESFSFIEDLREYAALDQSGSYVFQALLYPELYHAANALAAQPAPASAPIVSNRLLLSIRPRPLAGPDGIAVELDVETNAILEREKLPPDGVIDYILTALQKNQWEKYFLYLDIEAMISRDPNRRREWARESQEGRQRMVTRFKEELKAREIDPDLSMIPTRYEIERTTYNQQSGTVAVMQYFDMGRFVQKKRYIWYFEKKDDIWLIVDYAVSNLGTE